MYLWHMKFPLIAFLSIWMWVAQAQSGAVISVGYSSGFTDYSLATANGGFMSGWNAGIVGRFGDGKFFIRPGLELHKIYLESANKAELFTDRKSAYFLKIPAQIGYRIINLEKFKLIAMGGVQVSYIWSIQENALGLNHDTMKDFQLGALFGGGIDLGPLVFCVQFEKGLSELYTGTSKKSDYVIYTLGFSF